MCTLYVCHISFLQITVVVKSMMHMYAIVINTKEFNHRNVGSPNAVGIFQQSGFIEDILDYGVLIKGEHYNGIANNSK